MPQTTDNTAESEPTNFVELVMDDLPIALFCKDASAGYRFILWNKRQEEVTGIPREAALGKTDYALFSEELADTFREMDERVVASGKTIDIAEEEVRPAGADRVLWLHTVKTPVKDAASGHMLLLGVSEDVTERKIMSESLSRTIEELKQTQLQLIQAEKMESVGRLAAGVAHEVKNPLALLLMGVEYMDGGIDPDDPNLPEIMKEMREAINRADRIIRGLVDFSSSRKLDLQVQDVRPVIEGVLLLSRHDITRGSVDVTTDFEDDLPNVLLDNSKFEQVLLNVLINAIQAMGKDIARPKLKIEARAVHLESVAPDEGARTAERLRVGDRVVRIKIRDNGPGIPDEKLGKIFDPFFTTKPTGVGTGLGLSVVRNIIELHKGAISISNRPEGGVCVEILLRAVAPPSNPVDSDSRI